jgi:hypothetical protein
LIDANKLFLDLLKAQRVIPGELHREFRVKQRQPLIPFHHY